MPILDSPVCEWLWYLSIFLACSQCLPWLFSMWVAMMPYCVSSLTISVLWLSRMWVAVVPHYVDSLLTMLVLNSPFSMWMAVIPFCVSKLLTLWQCLPLAFQEVSIYGVSVCFLPANNPYGSPVCECPRCVAVFIACWCLSWLFSWLVIVLSCYISNLLTMLNPWLSSWWVAVVLCFISSLLTILILGSLESKWLWFLAILVCLQSLSLTS